MSFIAMNRFKITLGREPEFEEIWRSRESRLNEMKGFIEFRLLRGPQTDDYTLYSSHVIWDSREDFDAWRKSQQFSNAHKKAGSGMRDGVVAAPPQFEGFETVLEQRP